MSKQLTYEEHVLAWVAMAAVFGLGVGLLAGVIWVGFWSSLCVGTGCALLMVFPGMVAGHLTYRGEAKPPAKVKDALRASNKGVMLELFHGRKSLSDSLNDWGESGPIFGPLDFVHTTYQADIKCHELVLRIAEDCVYYDGMFYGDWSVYPEDLVNEGNRSRLTVYDASKAALPELVIKDRNDAQQE